MANIVILGAGVMGTSLTIPATDNGHDALLVGTPLDLEIVAEINRPDGVHPKLDEPCSSRVKAIGYNAMTPDQLTGADMIVVGVSSPGIGWAVDILNRLLREPRPVAFVTKGLDASGSSLATYAEVLPGRLPMMSHFIGIGGPCIARELANRLPTASVYACKDIDLAQRFAAMMGTSYYRLSVSTDDTGVEACAALKNFYAIGVSAMQTRYRDSRRGDGQAKNPTAAAFTQASLEMARLCRRLGGQTDTAFALAGIGDLHVTVGGGRNSRLGHGLGAGYTVPRMMSGELAGETVEGIDTARALATLFGTPLPADGPERRDFPLAFAIIEAVLEERPFIFDFTHLVVH